MKADVLNTVNILSQNQADTTMTPYFYDDAVYDLARLRWLTQVSFVVNNATGVLGLVNWPATAVELICMCYGGKLIGGLSLREAEYIFPDWRNVQSRPRAYTGDELSRGFFQLIPKPQNPTGTITGPFPSQTPEDMVTLFHTEYRANLYNILELPTAFFVLAREYAHEGPHQNLTVSESAAILGALLMKMIE